MSAQAMDLNSIAALIAGLNQQFADVKNHLNDDDDDDDDDDAPPPSKLPQPSSSAQVSTPSSSSVPQEVAQPKLSGAEQLRAAAAAEAANKANKQINQIQGGDDVSATFVGSGKSFSNAIPSEAQTFMPGRTMNSDFPAIPEEAGTFVAPRPQQYTQPQPAEESFTFKPGYSSSSPKPVNEIPQSFAPSYQPGNAVPQSFVPGYQPINSGGFSTFKSPEFPVPQAYNGSNGVPGSFMPSYQPPQSNQEQDFPATFVQKPQFQQQQSQNQPYNGVPGSFAPGYQPDRFEKPIPPPNQQAQQPPNKPVPQQNATFISGFQSFFKPAEPKQPVQPVQPQQPVQAKPVQPVQQLQNVQPIEKQPYQLPPQIQQQTPGQPQPPPQQPAQGKAAYLPVPQPQGPPSYNTVVSSPAVTTLANAAPSSSSPLLSTPLVSGGGLSVEAKRLAALKKQNAIRSEEIKAKRQAIDICFLMDITGTMEPWLELAKVKIVAIIGHVKKKFPEARIRVAFVGYADWDNRKPPRSHNFSYDFCEPDVLMSHIAKLEKADGWDCTEDVLGGLEIALRLEWWARTKLLIHIADDPAHGREFHDYGRDNDRWLDTPDPSGRGPEYIFEMIRTMCNKEIEYHFFHLDQQTEKMERRFDQELRKYGSQLFVHPLTADVESFLPAVLVAVTESMTRSFTRG